MHFISTFKKYTQESKPMNSKIVVGGAAGVLIAIIVVFTLTGNSVISDVEGGFFAPSNQGQEVLPIVVELFDLSILEVTDKQATLEIKFKFTNPNFKSVMLQHVKYSIYHDEAFSNLSSITAGQENILEFSFSKHD